MRTTAVVIISFAILFFSSPASSSLPKPEGKSIIGDFTMSAYLSTGVGWQHFSNAPITEWTNDGSFAGVLGSVLPNVATGVPPLPTEDIFMAFVEMAEIDIVRHFGERTRLRADLFFGRPFSGSWVGLPGIDIEQAFAAVMLSERYGIEFTLGRFITLVGFESTEPYFNDAISWSILSRSNIYPYFATGAQLSFGIADGVTLFAVVSNGVVGDTTARPNDVPAGLATLEVRWGEEDQESWFTLTPFIGPESGSNRHFSFGADAAFGIWATDRLQVGLDAVYHRDNSAGGENTDYAAGLLNLHYDFTERLFGFLRYTFARQFQGGNGVLNLTGAKQSIHEMSAGGGFQIVDGMKFKFEARTDAVVPAGSRTQWVPGVAMGLVCAL